MQCLWKHRITAFFLTFVFLFEILPASVLAVEQDADVFYDSGLVPQPTVVQEVEELRGEDSKHFQMSDGSYLAVAYGEPVHYQDEEGAWQDIDNALQPVQFFDGSTMYTAANGEVTTAFSADISQGQVFASAYGDMSVSMSLPSTAEGGQNALVAAEPYRGDAAAQLLAEPMALADENDPEQSLLEAILPQKLHSSVLYENVYEGVDLLYEVGGYHIKESIVVKQQRTDYRFSFRLELAGLTPELQEDGSVYLLDENDTVIYFIPAPYLIDAAGNLSYAATYTLTDTEETGCVLTVEADAFWMNASDRAYPVTIDPTLVLKSGNADGEIIATYITQGSPNTNHETYQQLYVGYGSASNALQQEVYLYFKEMPELPVGSVVVNATLGLFQNGYSDVRCPEMNIGLFEVTADKPANRSYESWIRQMTWNTRPAHDASNMIDYTLVDQNKWRYRIWEMTELVNKWYASGVENRTVALINKEAADYSSGHCAGALFYAYGQAAPPLLMVSYRNNTGIEPYYTYQTMGAGHAGTAYLSDFSGQLTVAKELFSFASAAQPFSAQLVYNSAYFAKRADLQYDIGKDLGLEMHLGSGCTYNFIQHVQKETIDGTTYIRYLDGDGTLHYFAPDTKRDAEIQKETGASTKTAYYYDEDGLGLKINEYATGYYAMTDDHGNEWVFVRGPLVWMQDSDGNKIILSYTKNGAATPNDYPSGAGDRLEKITQQNKGCEKVTLATFSYQSQTINGTAVANYLDTITDYAGNKYTFDYNQGKLTGIRRNSVLLASYTMRQNGQWVQNELIAMTDEEADYSLHFTYENHRVSAVEEQAGGITGSKTEIQRDADRRTIYRDPGQDRACGTNDDILTSYSFDYAGRTVNAYTTDTENQILGASNAVYSGSGSTDRTNNRTLRTASIGVAAQQELQNFSFESGDSSQAWSTSPTAYLSPEKPRTGKTALKTGLGANGGIDGASKRTNSLEAGAAYILSAYVNTSGASSCTGKGVYLSVKDGAGNRWDSPAITYKTSASVDDGWVRISLPFQAKNSVNHTVTILNENFKGAVFVDDVQLEKTSGVLSTQAASNVNLLENGNLEGGTYGWVMNAGASRASADGDNAIRVTGNPKENHYASQTVTVNLPGSETYVLSGWAMGNAVPDNKMDGDPETDKEAAAKDKNKQFGLRAVLTYAGGAVEYHYAPFNADLSDWQFTSLTIVPRQPDKTVSTIQVECAYEKNANTAWFDNLSLVREAAQTMRYDEKGNLESVTTTGLKADADTYENGNLIKSVTSGNGTFTYTYDETNKHRLKSVTNDVVTQSMTHDVSGNVTGTTLKSNTASFTKTLQTGAVYTSNNNLVGYVTDSANQKVTYTYNTPMSRMTGQATSVIDAKNNTTAMTYDGLGRISQKAFANSGRLAYTYTDGILSGVTRTDSAGKTQSLAYAHDAFGNLTSVKVGEILLASYQYAAKNGSLQKQTYGNGDEVTFQYDNLNRVTETSYSSGRTLTYAYTGDGQVATITDSAGGQSTVYAYTYDTLGRAIHCQTSRGIETQLQVHWEYDDCNRVSAQSWQMGDAAYTESFTYDEKDGSLINISTEGMVNELQLSYDTLERLSSVSAGLYTKNYTYRDVSATQTTAQVQSIRYDGLLNNVAWNYTYDALGNIASAAQNNYAEDTYTYDALGQLTSAILSGKDLGYSYTYDGAGNLQCVAVQGSVHTSDNYTNTYAYENTQWKDLLTAFNGEPIAYEGQTYDPAANTVAGAPVSGNPTSYFNGQRWSFDWAEGRSLVEAASSHGDTDTAVTYTYDANGLRTGKRVVIQTYETTMTHNYTPTVVAPTCTENGYTLYECACGDKYRGDTTPALGHDYVESGDTTAGYTYTCSRCGDSYWEHAHVYKTGVMEPTCTEDGYTLHFCECGHSYKDNITPKLGHDYVVYKIEMEQTTYRCTRCKAIVKVPSGGIIDPVDPPIVEYSLRSASEGCTPQRVLSSESTETHRYTYAGGKLLRETILTFTASGIITNEILDFRYDNAGLPYALIYQDRSGVAETYYYITNLQGDVMYMVDEGGDEVASYDYDPYGKLIYSTGDFAETNPIRYRGYYYDTDTDFYYLQSRYYDPAICRFINCDGFTTTGQGLLGYNMFSYCGNNPIVYADSKGSVRIAVIYDATPTKHNLWGINGKAIIGSQYSPIYSLVTIEGYQFTTDDEFVECWNSLQGEYDEIYIIAHGSATSASIWFETEDNYLGICNYEKNYTFDVLNPVKVKSLVTLYVCHAATEYDGVSTAQVFANLTSCKVKASEGLVFVVPGFDIGIAELKYGWKTIQPNTGNSNGNNENGGGSGGGGTRFNMRY